jgi:hypothetical protein
LLIGKFLIDPTLHLSYSRTTNVYAVEAVSRLLVAEVADYVHNPTGTSGAHSAESVASLCESKQRQEGKWRNEDYLC